MREKKTSKHIKKSAPAKKSGRREARLTALLVVLLAAAAIATGLSLPGLSAAIQSRRVANLSRQEELGSGTLKLTSDDAMLEKMRLISLSADGVPMETVALESGRFISKAEAADSLNDVFVLAENTGLYTGGPLNWNIIETIPFLLIPRGENLSPALMWIVEAEMDSGDESFYLELIVDDATGLLLSLSFYGETGSNINEMQTLNFLTKNLSAYYGFLNIQLAAPSPDETEAYGYENTYYIHCFKNGEQVFDIPVRIDRSGWQICGCGIYSGERKENN